ncbi:nitrogen fixation protein NifZ [Ectothiorhodospiraceae bacterium BW-2]|nr:nitrogen fixation protein NifZ [Ectothiorhodospiraceae bacterium BW-2]
MDREELSVRALQSGDMLYAAKTIVNDGSIPAMEPQAVIATAGTRGVLVNTGHYEETPDITIYLVRFENSDGELGLPVGCYEDELRTASS